MGVVRRPPKEEDKVRHQTAACMIADEPIGQDFVGFMFGHARVCSDHIYVFEIAVPRPEMLRDVLWSSSATWEPHILDKLNSLVLVLIPYIYFINFARCYFIEGFQLFRR